MQLIELIMYTRRGLTTLALGLSLWASTSITAIANAPEEPAEEEALFTAIKVDYQAADPVLGLIDSRQRQSLNGAWQLTVDPMQIGMPNTFRPGFLQNQRPVTGMELIEYDVEAGPAIRVPGDFNSQMERLFFYQGQVWYFRKFDWQPQADTRQHLWFGGANFETTVYVNGATIGRHRGGYVPFSFDVTDHLREGSNDLLVAVNNTLNDASVPTARTDWWPYGGLTRDVALVSTPAAFVRNASIWLEDHVSGRIQARVQTANMAAGESVTVSIEELGVAASGTVDESGNASVIFSASPALWTPESPRLYDVSFSAASDRVTDRVGFRTIATRGKQILLNGKPIKLRGVAAHEEPIGEAGVSYTRAHAERLLSEVKALNGNFMRAAHYPHSRYLAQVADELGVMLWEEVPVYWNIQWENADTLDLARDQIRRLIERDWNRASVIIWSVANETPYSEPRMTFLKQLITDCRTLDGSRLVSAALLGGLDKFDQLAQHLAARALQRTDLSEAQHAIFTSVLAGAGDHPPGADDVMTLEIDDPLGEFVDIVAYNEYFGWYYSAALAKMLSVDEGLIRELMLAHMRVQRITSNVDKPIHMSEFGAGAKFGNRGGEALIWTEEYQALVYQRQLEMLAASDQVQGLSPWVLKDFRAMLRTHPTVQQFYNRKGLVDPDGNRKQAFSIMQTFYAGEWSNSH